MYTIHGFINGEAVPLVVSLLSDKAEQTYVDMFTVIQVRGLDLVVVLDIER